MVRWSVRTAVATVAFASFVLAILAAPVWAEPPIEVPPQLGIGSTITVPAPCRLTASDRLIVEFDPLFESPTYYIQFLEGPAAQDGSVHIRVPAEAIPGRYVLRGTCEIIRGEGDVTSPLDQYATIDPVEVELVIDPAVANTAQPDYTG